MKRAALIVGSSVVALLCAGSLSLPGPMAAVAAPAQPAAAEPERPAKPAPVRKAVKKRSKPAEREADKTPALPPGPLHIIVSIDKQRVTLFADGAPVAHSPISSGTVGHPTPLGVFSVLQKRRHHVSNLYDAKMPYMQRLTWSGTAMHQGPLPGHPASHGCIRLPDEFAQLLWKATKIGARVIITRDEVAPVAIEHANLFTPKPQDKPQDRPHDPAQPLVGPAPKPRAALLVKTADATNSVPITVVADAVKPAVDKPVRSIDPIAEPVIAAPVATKPAANSYAAEQPTKMTIDLENGAVTVPVPKLMIVDAIRPAAPRVLEPVAPTVAAPVTAQIMAEVTASVTMPLLPIPAADGGPAGSQPALGVEAKRRTGPVSVFVSRRERKLYVRQGMEPLFDTTVAIERPDETIGTHVFTAMSLNGDPASMRWTVVSIPSAYKRPVETKKTGDSKKPRNSRVIKAAEQDAGPPPSPRAALDRIVMPPDAVQRIAELVSPGSSLILSDNKLSDETGPTTDFIVETP